MEKTEFNRKSLSLKYRPTTLEDYVGQDTIVSRFKGILKTLTVPSAFLLVGMTGSGKTTFARIIAKYLNCATLNACGKCKSCLAMESGNHMDYTEINAADTRGIDDMRSLIKKSIYKPTMGNLRIFVIDETQGLTPQAFQALLKSLEEPTENTLWILCSMEPEKLPPSIVNRCQTLTIKPIERTVMLSRLKDICKREKVKLTEDILGLIVEYSGGQMRLALQHLDAVLQFLKVNPDLEGKEALSQLEKEFEATDDTVMIKLLTNIWAPTYKGTLNTVLDISDLFMMSRRLVDAHLYLIQQFAGVSQHSKIWHTPTLKKLFKVVVARREKRELSNEGSVVVPDALDALIHLNALRDTIATSYTQGSMSLYVQYLTRASECFME